MYLAFVTALRWTTPFYYGNVMLAQKMPLFKQNCGQYNTAIFGNSTVNRQFNPVTFDSLTESSTHTFNLSSDGTPFEECAFILENFLNDECFENVKTVFLVVNHSQRLRDENKNTYKIAYYHDLKRLQYNLAYRYDDPEDKRAHWDGFLENMLGRFRFSRIIEMDQAYATRPLHGVSHRGFDPTSQMYGGFEKDASSMRPDQAEALLAYAKRTTSESQAIHRPFSKRDSVLYHSALNLKKEVESQGKVMHYIFLPNDPNYFRYKIPNSIYLGDGPEFPEFFEPTMRFNAAHLNDIGSEIYSERIAQKYNEHLAHGGDF